MKVTVIVLTYNQADTIGRTLDSILAQRVNFDYEILIGDDASTDATRHVCEEYQSRHPQTIRLMPQAPNKGVTHNYFDCLENSTGEYIADCAGDDWWVDPLKLQRQVEFLDRHKDVALVHSAWRSVDSSTGKTGPDIVLGPESITTGREILLALLRHEQPQPIHLCTAIYRRSMLMTEYEADRDLFRNGCAEDLTVMAMLCARHPIGYLPQVVLNYSVRGAASVSNPASLARAAAFYRGAIGLTASIARKTGVEIQAITPALRRLHAYALYLAVESGSENAVTELEQLRTQIGLTPTPKARGRLLLYKLRKIFS